MRNAIAGISRKIGTNFVSSRQRPARGVSVASAAAIIAAAASQALASVSFTGSPYVETFDSLPNSGTPIATWGPATGAQAVVPSLTTWDGVKLAGNGANPMNFTADDGTLTSGALYSYGASGDGDRALGALGSGSNAGGFGFELVNNSAFTMTSFTLSFTAEQWRSSTSTQNTLSFAYGITGGGMSSGDYLSSASMTAVPQLNAPALPPVGANSATDGNNAAFQTAVSFTVNGINVPIGASLFLRWQDFNDIGSDAGIGIDNLTFSSAPPTGLNLNWNGAGGSSTWQTGGSTNWLNGATPTAFTNGDTANFTDAGIATGSAVTISGTVLPQNTNVSNTSGTYTFSGTGDIGGTGALVKTGAGALVINTANTYTGGTTINGGLVTISNDNNLGAASGGIALGGGSLQTNAAITSTRAITLTGASPSTIDTNGFNSSFSGTVAGTGWLVKRGTGSLTFSGNYNATGSLSVAAGTLVLAQPSGIVSFSTGTSGSDFAGNLEIVNPIQVSFGNGQFSGGGTIRVNSTGSSLATSGAGNTATIGNNIVLNPSSAAGFSTNINATFNNNMFINGVISGASDVIWSILPTTPTGGGIVTLGAQNTYTGSSRILNTSGGVIRLGVNDALPTTTDLIFGTGSVNVGALDLAGFSQSVRSLASDTSGTINGIANTGGASTLTVTGGSTTVYNGTIGTPLNTSQLPGFNDDISLVLSNTHTGVLEFTSFTTNTYTGGTTINGGELRINNDSNLGGTAGALTFGGGTLFITGGGINSGRAINVNAGGGSINTNGNDTVYSTSVAGAGTFRKDGGGILEVNNFQTAGLNVQGGTVRITPNGTTAGRTNVNTLTIAGGTTPTAKLDITNNAAVVDYTGGSPLSTIAAQIGSAYAGGAWSGNGITSSNANANNFAVGFAEASALTVVPPLFGTVDSSSVLIRYTRFGDADIDGQVNSDDFNRLASSFGQSGKVWSQGNFNYDPAGNVNSDDFNLLATNFGLAATGLNGEVTPQDWANLAAAVPEPSVMGLLTTAGILALRRRRR